MTKTFDAIIIGAGQAGPSLAGRLTGAGMSVALIERKLIGGTCVNTGCTPTKTLIASAYAAQMARRASDYGLTIGGGVGVDMKKVKARKDYRFGQFAHRPGDLAKTLGQLHRLRRPCPLRDTARCQGRRRIAIGRSHLPQRRRPRARDGWSRPGQLLDQYLTSVCCGEAIAGN